LLQLLVSLRQYYPKRHWLREMLTDLEISLSYHLEERALLVGQILVSVSTFYLNYNIFIVITMQKKGLKFKEVYHPCHHLQELVELMNLTKTRRGEWFFLLNPYPSLSMKSDML
jgi:hypothetical protein